MKNIILAAAFLSSGLFAGSARADISKEAGALEKDLSVAFLKAAPQGAPFKMAVLNFDEAGTDAQKSKAGQVISAALIQKFSADPSFRVIERERLDAIFKELRFSLSGVVDQKDVKRAGAILGTDYLVLGSVSESDGKFLIQARMANVETGVVAAAASVTMEKSLLLKESEEFYAARLGTAFSAFLGSAKVSDMKLTGTHIGAELRHNFTKRQFGAVQLFKLVGDNSNIYKTQATNAPFGFPPGVSAQETFKSLAAISASYGLMQKLPFQTRLTAQAGPALYIMDADQKYFFTLSNPVMTSGVNLPASNSITYYAPGFQAGLGLERNLARTLIAGVSFSYHSFSFKRKLDPGAANTPVKPFIELLNEKLSVSGSSFSARLSFCF